jgi:integrase
MAKKGMLSSAAALKLKPAADRREIPDAGAGGLYLVIQPSGTKSWAMRFRRPNGVRAKLVLGPLASQEIIGDPQIGQPLTPAAARALAAQINRQRAMGVDVVAARRSEKRRRQTRESPPGAGTFALAVRDFVDRHARPKTRRWRETARMLGLEYPLDGNGDPTTIKNGLCDRWSDKPLTEIDGDDIYAIVDESKYAGIPGLGRKNKAASDARGRSMADALGTIFGWLHQHRRIKTDPSIGVHRPGPPPARDRVLNVKTDVRNADELRWFWTACDTAGYPFGDLCKVLLLTGCRREEIARATWAELSDDLSTLRLAGNRTKNGLAFDAPLPPLAREILGSAPRVSATYVFSTNSRTPISGFSKFKARLDALMLAEAIKERGKSAAIAPWRVHDLRRSAATGMAGIGVNPWIIEACLNHVSGAKASVAGIYNRERHEPEKRAALERWTAHVAGVVSGRADGTVVPIRGRAT